jgi:hypothetical protein
LQDAGQPVHVRPDEQGIKLNGTFLLPLPPSDSRRHPSRQTNRKSRTFHGELRIQNNDPFDR